MIEVAQSVLRQRLPEKDDNAAEARRIVECIMADREITRVDDVVERLGLNKRSLQRLFSQYIGVSPKWVIKRYRLHVAVAEKAHRSMMMLSLRLRLSPQGRGRVKPKPDRLSVYERMALEENEDDDDAD